MRPRNLGGALARADLRRLHAVSRTTTELRHDDEAIKISAATGVPMDWMYTGNLACFLPAHLAARIRAIEEAERNPLDRRGPAAGGFCRPRWAG
jgi:hypothetical protein